MPRKTSTPFRGDITPGELYKRIAITRRGIERAEEKLVKLKPNWFVGFCRSVYRRFPSLGRGGKFTKENREAVEFLGWGLGPEEFVAASKFTLITSLFLSLVIGVIVYASPLKELVELVTSGIPFLTPIYIFAPLIIISLYITNYVQTYPTEMAKLEQIRALTYVPEILGYMVMSMKLTPNLEKAIEFSAEHGRGKVADDFKKLIWDVQIGVYTTLSEGLDVLAYKWGKFSEEFKKSLMMIRASVIETTEAKRHALLDKTMSDILASIRGKMEQYARDLSQPTIMLFYIGILLPLILIIVLPVGSSFSGAPIANPIVLILIYNIIIPAITVIFAVSLVKRRPPTYEAPIIPKDFPDLPPKWKMVAGKVMIDLRIVILGVIILGVLGSIFLSQQGLPPRFMLEEGDPQLISWDKTEEYVLDQAGRPANYFEISNEGYRYAELRSRGYSEERAEEQVLMEKQLFLMRSENDVAPYNLIFGLLITGSVVVFFYLYYTSIYRRKIQLEVMEMETEFKDSLYVLASRMGENKPVEEAMKHTKEFLPNFKISDKIFGRVIDNISLLAMPLEAAVFDPNYGALKNNPSAIIKGSMKLLIDSVQLGVNVAARTMISLSMQLSNTQEVSRTLKVLVSETTGMMKTMALFIGPIVLGITTSLQRIVIITLSSIASSQFIEQASQLTEATGATGVPIPGSFTGVNISSFVNTSVIGSMASSTEFIIIVALYVVELVLIMCYFTTKIEEDNDLLVKINIAKYMPVAITVFVLSIIVSNFVVVGFLGG